jgi:hypothetical protein
MTPEAPLSPTISDAQQMVGQPAQPLTPDWADGPRPRVLRLLRDRLGQLRLVRLALLNLESPARAELLAERCRGDSGVGA